MKGMYSIYCMIILGFFAYVSLTGRTFLDMSSKRHWSKPGQRTIYYHK